MSDRRFDIGLSFPGEHRPYVEEVATKLAAILSKNRVLYDDWCAAEFARLDLDTYLPNLYRTQSELVAIFLCPEYKQKRWCRLEWRAIKQLIATADSQRIMLLRYGFEDDYSELGIYDGDGVIDFKKHPAAYVVERIYERLCINRGAASGERAAFSPVSAPNSYDISRIDSYAPESLIGREAETKMIDDAWAAAVRGEAKRPRVLSFVAMGGEGKTSLVADWAVRKQIDGWSDCDAAFTWSFYSQGTRDNYAGDSDLFLAEALKFFGEASKEGEGAVEKAKRLARLIGEKRTLLILDGLEPLQYPPTWQPPGELKDDAMAALLKALAANGKGLCLVTTRHSIPNLRAYRSTNAPEHDLKRLSKEAGAHLLNMLGVVGTQKEREELSEEAKGHALTLTLIGGYLRDAHGGDIRKRDLFNLAEADEEGQGGHAFRAMAAYVRWFEHDKGGRRALGMLRLMGLFDRPADFGCLRALWRGPEIKGLTESIVGLSEAHRNIAIQRLEDAKLLTVNREGGALVSLDAHPLLREYFEKELREKNPDGWKAAHKRLYEHLCATETDKKEAPTLDDLRPLYQAVAHGCQAGFQQEACDEVYYRRILRGTGPDGFYSWKKLDAMGADLGAVACFFDSPWTWLSPNLAQADQAWLLAEAGNRLRPLGRLREALRSMETALAMRVEQQDWRNAAVSANNISEVALTLGDIEAAVQAGASSVDYADRSHDTITRVVCTSTHAEDLHQQGFGDAARALFEKVDGTQEEIRTYYSMLGFRYCDLLLGPSERAVWKRVLLPCASEPGDSQNPRSSRAEGEAIQSGGAVPGLLHSAINEGAEISDQLLDACEEVAHRGETALNIMLAGSLNRLDIALGHLTPAGGYAAMLRGAAPDGAHIDAAVNGLLQAGERTLQPHGFLTRALYRAVTDDFAGAREDLDEAYDIAERGPMKLHLADIHLHRARLFGLYAKRPENYPWDSPARDLAEARRLIEECGYWRRKEELEDAEAALRALARK
ncbi:TIR domain-containing protein [Methylocystis rosea]|uniref:TIR domain-containing protein n=1 Tax=Methylocystis rosea TaxID=173366 RepID=UPI00036AE4C4|nr:TIR domain-containing protein [Methylocystis rosea]